MFLGLFTDVHLKKKKKKIAQHAEATKGRGHSGKGRSSDDDQSRTDQKEGRPRKVKPIQGLQITTSNKEQNVGKILKSTFNLLRSHFAKIKRPIKQSINRKCYCKECNC